MTLPRKQAYDEAVAVFSPAVRFAEWKMYEVDSEKPPYYPFAIKGVKSWDTWAEIEGERWIYAFRRPASDAQYDGRNTSPAVLVDELFLDDKGKLHAVDTDKLLHGDKIVERDDRGKPQEIGDTVSFVRQLFGVNFDYWFFGARIRLPSAALKKIMSDIPLWTSRTHFSPDDPNVVWGTSQSQTPLIPILDPITVARYLHTYFISAANDLLKYLAPVDDPDDRDSDEKKKRAIKRQKKLALAHIVDGLLEADNGNLGTRAKVSTDGQAALFDFLTDYTKQIEYRTKWRDRWATWLCNWLASDPIAMLADAYMVDEEHEFPSFFLEMALCHSRINETEPGRKLLEAHFSKAAKYKWIRKYVLGREGDLKPEFVQAIRKTGSAPIEFIKEHVPVWMAKSIAQEIEEHLNELFGEDHVVAQKFTTATGTDLYMTWVKKDGKEILEFKEVDEAKILTARKKLELSPKWHGAVGSLAAGLELINFGLKIRAFAEAYHGEDLYKKVISFVDMVGAGLDLTAAGMFLLDVSEHAIAKVGFVSAMIDAVLSFNEAREAFFEGKFGKALGASVVGIGSVVVGMALLFEASAVPIGLLIVALGYMIELWFSDDNDYQVFVAHSSFGDASGEGEEKPGWYTTDKTFREWPDDLDEQLCAAVMLLCKFDIEPDDDDARGRYKTAVEVLKLTPHLADADTRTEAVKEFGKTMRSFTLKMRWMPTGSKLHFSYFETWKQATDQRSLHGTLEIATDGPKLDSSNMDVDAHDLQSIEVSPHAGKALTTADYGLMDAGVVDLAVVAWINVEMFGKKYEVRAKDSHLYRPEYGKPFGQ